MSLLNKTIDLSKVYDNKFIKILINILFCLSTASLTEILIVHSFSSPTLDIALLLLSFFIMLFVCFKFDLLKKIFTNTNKIILIVSIILGLYALYITYTFTNEYILTHSNVLYAFFAIFSSITFLYWFYTKLWYYLKLFFKSLDKMEKNFLIIAISVFAVAIIIIYNLTSVFTHAQIAEEDKNYVLYYSEENEQTLQMGQYMKNDVFRVLTGNLLFTADTQFIIDTDAYSNINAKENDIRQPFFGLFTLPFTIAPRLIADITFNETYPFLIAIVQGFLVFVTIILLGKMMKLTGITRLIFMLFLTFTYPTLLFLINMEQYVIHVFYLIVFIYMAINKIKDKDILYIMATGTLVTSGILFPLLGEKKNFKESIKNIFFTFLKFAAILIITGKIVLYTPEQLHEQYNNLVIYTNGADDPVATDVQANMYTNFALNTVIAPKIKSEEALLAGKVLVMGDLKARIQAFNYKLQQTENTSTNVFGLVILGMVVLGFILNRKDSFSKICFAWVLFSVFLLLIVGYGAKENGFLLYSYYFSWAFVCLLFKLFETLLKKWPKIKNTIYTLAIIPISLINFYGIYQLIIFGMQYYV